MSLHCRGFGVGGRGAVLVEILWGFGNICGCRYEDTSQRPPCRYPATILSTPSPIPHFLAIQKEGIARTVIRGFHFVIFDAVTSPFGRNFNILISTRRHRVSIQIVQGDLASEFKRTRSGRWKSLAYEFRNTHSTDSCTPEHLP